jgi:hypothetical protein
MKVRWVTIRKRKGIAKIEWVVKEKTFNDFTNALVEFIKLDNDNYVEAVEWISDKGDGAPVRGNKELRTLEEIVEHLNLLDEGDEDAAE